VSISLAYREYGQGPALVVLHGLFGSRRNWQTIAERLAGQYRLFVCDLRNHGASPWAETMSYPEMADDLEALIEKHGLAPVVVLGHSVGGKAAMLTALKHPELVDSLVIVDIAPVTYEEPFLAYIEAMQAADVEHASRKSDVDQVLAGVISNPATRMFLLQNLEECHGGGFAWRLNLEAIAANMPALLGFPEVSALAYEGRALFMSGSQSEYIGRRYHGEIYDLFPQAEFAVLDGAGHYPHIEMPEPFVDRLTDFLDSAYA